MKKFTSFILPAAMMLAIPVSALAADFTVDGLKYSTLDDTTVGVKSYVSGTDVVIPETVTDGTNTYTVVSILEDSFFMAGATSVKVPATVKDIQPYAFWKAQIQEIELAEGLERIGYTAFRQCPNLTTVVLPSTLELLGYVSTLTGAEGSVFYGCPKLQKVVVPASVKKIPSLTFAECYNITEIELNEGLEAIGERAFENCKALKELNLPTTLTTLERGALSSNGLVSPTVPGSVKIIPNSCFIWCYDMTEFTIEEGLEEIGKQSCAECDGFTEINVPNSVEWIRSDAFHSNEHVKTIHIGNGIRRLGNASLAVWRADENNQPRWELTDIYIESPVPPVHEQNDDHLVVVEDDFFFGDKSFSDEKRAEFYASVTLHVPGDVIDTYKQADIWKNFTKIIAIEGTGFEGVEDIKSENALTISGNIVVSSMPICVYDIAGTLVTEAPAGTLNLDMLGKGIYIVRSGAEVVKTMVR